VRILAPIGEINEGMRSLNGRPPSRKKEGSRLKSSVMKPNLQARKEIYKIIDFKIMHSKMGLIPWRGPETWRPREHQST